MPVDDQLKSRIVQDYDSRFGVQVTSVQEGAEGIFRGSLLIATYKAVASEPVRDVVYIDNSGNYTIFDSTQELILFLQDKTRFIMFDAFIQSRMFHAIVLLLLIVLVFWAGSRGDGKFDSKALAILGSVVGLAAGLFFGPSRK